MLTNMAQDQNWSAKHYAENASFVPQLTTEIVGLLDVETDDRILDLGCGDGVLTRKISHKCKSIIGIDSSANMIAAAKQLGVDARVISGQELVSTPDLQQEDFDKVFSNAALHWILRNEPDTTIQGVYRALKNGGKLVAELGGFGNCADVCTALRSVLLRRGISMAAIEEANPWIFPSEHVMSEMLTRNGFQVQSITRTYRSTELPGNIKRWFEIFAGAFLKLVSEGEKNAVLDELEQILRGSCQREDGKWFVGYVRLRVVAIKNV
ncbi:putative methyltransferase [Neolecta irregularis DAH-3]|uniref:Putative methyltransferase n=1 Tax=Neolecta irregularis (strain DAH-3) TaxID=1198029 RepID=A0A1U7LWQ3_NEOID|nr:putative methyltransferase [Neolecta irregularis DAH-3]|eukprot:OLL27106.1 putative methyltransferase [Neolecta irregularis DAH-3]